MYHYLLFFIVFLFILNSLQDQDSDVLVYILLALSTQNFVWLLKPLMPFSVWFFISYRHSHPVFVMCFPRSALLLLSSRHHDTFLTSFAIQSLVPGMIFNYIFLFLSLWFKLQNLVPLSSDSVSSQFHSDIEPIQQVIYLFIAVSFILESHCVVLP